MDGYADRRQSDHVQFGRLRDGDDRSECNHTHIRLYRRQPHVDRQLLGNTTTSPTAAATLQSIEDPAPRFTTFTQSGGNLTQADLPDGSTWGYSYASGGQLTQITDPTVEYSHDRLRLGSRVSTVALPDSTTEEFTNDQEAGWTNSGTSLQPGPRPRCWRCRQHLHQPQQQR